MLFKQRARIGSPSLSGHAAALTEVLDRVVSRWFAGLKKVKIEAWNAPLGWVRNLRTRHRAGLFCFIILWGLFDKVRHDLGDPFRFAIPVLDSSSPIMY